MLTPRTSTESIDDLVDQHWDAIVVGTGMGGATLGYALAQQGKKVLFCERGLSSLEGRGSRGDYAEVRIAREPASVAKDISRASARPVRSIVDLSSGRAVRFVPFVGEGTGGSTALYGMALERLASVDFEGASAGSAKSRKPAWPISYDEMSPYYERAERLYRVRGSPDPLRQRSSFAYRGTAPPYSVVAEELVRFFEQRGLHPYALPLACADAPGCEGCQGFLCAKRCKYGSAEIALEPALRDHHATLIDDFDVVRLEATTERVTGVVARRDGREYVLKGTIVVLAAGALATPALLLRSVSATWPAGLANRSGLVGRNLMRHYVDLYAVFTRSRPPKGRNLKEIGINDWYDGPKDKLGSIQSFGPMPPGRVLVDSMEEDLRAGRGRALASAFRLVKPLLRVVLQTLSSRTVVLATIVEDRPDSENQVLEIDDAAGDPTLAFRYLIDAAEQARIESMRDRMRDLLKPYRFLLLKQAENNQRLAHVCGTCRFGDDPATSVLDRTNKAHGLRNLYCVDASFFPSSGGTNPSLTIAANALRVAEHIGATWQDPVTA